MKYTVRANAKDIISNEQNLGNATRCAIANSLINGECVIVDENGCAVAIFNDGSAIWLDPFYYFAIAKELRDMYKGGGTKCS